ncbi:hypothetical protein ACRALDRAFT_1093649 [Sodiomyces alcalophilus JCM 7366]|uniref:uncharacterized protein n=1 Tax=Sodiomyces alcalophilus JCM 7366 TaxID=591952 RepID=UPI0039B53AFE
MVDDPQGVIRHGTRHTARYGRSSPQLPVLRTHRQRLPPPPPPPLLISIITTHSPFASLLFYPLPYPPQLLYIILGAHLGIPRLTFPSTWHRSSQSQASKPFTPSRRKRPNGLYDNGTWYCNCEPRKVPSSYTVKKPGPTKGKSFLRCHDCNFFMWNEDAAQFPVTESQAPTPDTATRRTPSPKKAKTMFEFFPKSPKPPTAQKRKRVQFEEDYIGDESSDEERQLLEAVERSARKMQRTGAAGPVSTPTAPTATSSSTTMAATSGGEDALPRQPNPPTARTLFAGPDTKRQNTSQITPTTSSAASAAPAKTGLPSPTATPTANRRKQVATPAGPEHEHHKHDTADTALRDEVMALLQGQPIPPAVARSVREALDRQVERARGLAKGRDAVRDLLRQKDEKVAQLQDRVVALENKLRAERDTRTNMRAGIMRLYQDY